MIHTVAIVIKTNPARFFCGFSKAGRVQTAWSLAGAKLFLSGMKSDDDLRKTTEKLREKNKDFEVVCVGQVSEPQDCAAFVSLGGAK